MDRIAIVCFTDYTKEPRVLRTIAALKDSYEIDIYSSVAKSGVIDVSRYDYDENFLSKYWIINKVNSFINILRKSKFPSDKYFEEKYWSKGRKELLEILKRKNYKLTIGHGIYIVPILNKLSENSKTIFNAHEYYEKEFEENENWLYYTKPYYEFILKKYLSRINLMFCVCSVIEQEYKKKYAINSVVITNARNYTDLSPANNRERGNIRLVHHGAAIRGRNLEKTIDVIQFLPDNYELNIMLVPLDKQYYNELIEKYKQIDRVKFIDAVEIEEIPALLNKFDLGIYILPPTNYNNLAALPNKFFDFIQARLCLALSPNIEMKNIIEHYKLGVVGKGFESEDLAQEITKLSYSDMLEYKNNCNLHARILSADNNKIIIETEVKKLLLS